jgi:hypothetical protein
VARAVESSSQLPTQGRREPTLVCVEASQRTRAPLRDGEVSVYSTFIVQSIYGAIQEYAGIDRPEWLDL